MSIYRRHGSPFYLFDFTLDGHRIRRSTKTTTSAAAEVAEAAERTRRVGTGLGTKLRFTLDQAFARYWLDHAHRLASAGDIAWRGDKIIGGIGRTVSLNRLTDDAVATYVARRRGEVSDSSVNRELTLLRAVLHMARDRWGAAVATPNWRAHFLREPAPRDRYLTPAEADKVLAAAAPHIKPAIELSLLTGIRLGNCVGLDWSQVDMHARELRLRLKSKLPRGKPHAVPLPEPAWVILANMGARDKGPVFTYRGRAIKSWKKAWRRACARAGVEGVRWHDLRHTAASWMVQAGVPLDVVKDVLGHETIATTLRYAHRATDVKRDAVAAAAAHWRRAV